MTADAGRLERELAELIAGVSGGELSPEEVLAGEHPLSALGLTSLARIHLIDEIEDTYGVDIDLRGALPSFEHVATLAAALAPLLEGDRA
ncbi:acyl carrier protein [Nonomuraea mesophila]|uniref:Acyl carrier protein n=1 Tax=Nonomuraea mesophila TaxID=2530382 RepID=A0A4R5FNU0_9ACTN|nr:acyl carrier protein [Nonomuraea mesophila]TDE54672.1 acyl carrier protein [Nonomuraea mesophila]